MKYIEKKYQQLIEDINNAHHNTCDALRDQIEDLKETIQDKNEEIKKLKGDDKLRKEFNEYIRLETQRNMNLEDEITQLKAENARIKKAYSDLEKAYKITVEPASFRHKGGDIVVHHCGENKPKVYKPKTRKKSSKTIVARCKDCGTYFQAKSKLAKYCSKCRAKHIRESKAKWLAKQK